MPHQDLFYCIYLLFYLQKQIFNYLSVVTLFQSQSDAGAKSLAFAQKSNQSLCVKLQQFSDI